MQNPWILLDPRDCIFSFGASEANAAGEPSIVDDGHMDVVHKHSRTVLNIKEEQVVSSRISKPIVLLDTKTMRKSICNFTVRCAESSQFAARRYIFRLSTLAFMQA